MTLTTTDGEDVTYGGGGGHANDTFTKVHTMDVKTVSKSNTTGLLVDGGMTVLGTVLLMTLWLLLDRYHFQVTKRLQ